MQIFKVKYFVILLLFPVTLFSQVLQPNDSSIIKIPFDSLNIDSSKQKLINKENIGISDSAGVVKRQSRLGDLEKTGKEIDTSAILYGWILDKYFIQPEKAEIDTDLVGFQIDNPMIFQYYSASFLGNIGSAYIPNNFFDRNYYEDLLYLNSYKQYFNTYDNTCYINTRKPFTKLIYYNAGSKKDKYEYIEFYHTQNVNRKFNFGFDLKILSDRGQYKYLDTKNKAFKLFSSYNGDIYTFHSNININRYQASENGGIIDSIFLNDYEKYTKSYPVNFSGEDSKVPYTAYVTNKVRYIDAMLSQQVKIFTFGKSSGDSTGKSNIAEPILSHVLIARRSSKLFEESSLNDPVFPISNYSYVNPFETSDSIAEFRVINKLQLDFKTKFKNKITVGVFANVNHEYITNSYFSLLDSTLFYNENGVIKTDSSGNSLYYVNGSDTMRYSIFKDRNNDTLFTIDRTHNYSNIYLSGGLYGKFWTYFQSRFSATLYLAGYKAGQTQVDGEMLTQLSVFSKPFRFLVKGSIENLKPSYQLNNYYSNNYVWEQDFSNFTRINLSSKIAAPSNKFELSFNYSLLRNYIYLTDSVPMVYDKPFNLMALELEKEFKLWKFHSYNKVIYQVTENKEIVDVPTFILYNSTYFDHTWKFKETKGELRTMVGFDVHYNSYFSGYNYIPASSMFYQENSSEIGGYPYIDFWLNVKLKRTRFFAKYEHANSDWYRKDYYQTVSYPAKQKVFKFGLSWTFYD